MPRQLCLFESLPCREVRLHEMRSFARVQAQRLSPFRRTGASAVRRNGRLHLWMWDADEVDGYLAAAGEPGRSQSAESIYIAWPAEDGVHQLRSTQAMDEVVVQSGVLTAAAVGNATMDLQLDALAGRAIGFDWIGGALDAGASSPSTLDTATVFNRAGLVAALAALGYMGYEGGRLWGAQDASVALEARLQQHASARSELAGLENSVLSEERWLQSYAKASTQLDVTGLLNAMRPVMEAHGVVIREFDASSEQARVVFATAGGEMQLPELLLALRRVAGLRDVRLDQHKELREASFVMEAPGFMKHVALRAEAGT